MSGFLSRIFGGKGKKASGGALDIVQNTLEELFEKSGFDLTFDAQLDGNAEGSRVIVEVSGEDEELLREREGQLLDALQFFIKRVVQHELPETKVDVVFDSNGYREESNQALIELADKLKSIVLEKKKSVYFRALPPKDRKVIHQYLAEDQRVRSRSIGDGLYKKIKIFPADGGGSRERSDEGASDMN